MLTLLLLLGCAPEPNAPTAPVARTEVSPAPAPATPAATTSPTTSPATSPATSSAAADRYGLTLGRSTHEDVLAWLSARQLTCNQFPAPTRTSFYYRCEGDLPTSLLPDRTIHGKLTQLLITRPENAPIYHFSTLRKYSLGPDAILDYDSSVAAISAQLGEPSQSRPLGDPSVLDRPLARASAAWQAEGLDVTVVLMKLSGPTISVTETWNLSELQASVEGKARDGSIQGGDGKRPPGWNPHVSEIPTLTPR